MDFPMCDVAQGQIPILQKGIPLSKTFVMKKTTRGMSPTLSLPLLPPLKSFLQTSLLFLTGVPHQGLQGLVVLEGFTWCMLKR